MTRVIPCSQSTAFIFAFGAELTPRLDIVHAIRSRALSADDLAWLRALPQVLYLPPFMHLTLVPTAGSTYPPPFPAPFPSSHRTPPPHNCYGSTPRPQTLPGIGEIWKKLDTFQD